ncbi:putative phytanoyl-CoA dioxygenase isoform X1 [Sycon ciliatum]|uniref:putative phytanoyl-CoA dioxygenase isoform X1 n=1 Tax=Sycon ciliatum TaxID=27933 RepID=UPI0031F6D1A2
MQVETLIQHCLVVLASILTVAWTSATQEDLLRLYHYTLVHGDPAPPPAGATMEEVIKLDPDDIHSAALIPIPRDKDDPRYVQSFNLDEAEAYRTFFKQHGFVVIRDAISQEACNQSIDEMWEYIEDRGYELHRWLPPMMVDHVNRLVTPDQLGKVLNKSRIRRDDPSSWSNDWPPLDGAGIVGALPVFTRQALLNRQNPNVYEAFANIMERKDLMVSHDRLGLFRPLRNAKNRLVKPRKKWKTAYSLHWDLNPWRHTLDDDLVMVQGTREAQRSVADLKYIDPNDFFLENNEIGMESEPQVNTQGMLNLADNLEEDGGFHLVVGFHKELASWSRSTRDLIAQYFMDKNFIPVHGHDPMYKQPQRVPMRAGSLLIWDQRVAHGSRPNNSTRARYVQFVKMFPSINLRSERAKYRGQLIKDKVELAGVDLTDLGKKLFALKAWASADPKVPRAKAKKKT